MNIKHVPLFLIDHTYGCACPRIELITRDFENYVQKKNKQ